MNIRQQAELDLSFTLEDLINGFGTLITLTNKSAQQQIVNGQSHRIGTDFDPQTGIPVVGNRAAITVRLSALTIGIPEEGWSISFNDQAGNTITGKANKVMNDNTLGVSSIILRVSK